VNGGGKLSAPTLRLIQNADIIYISAISAMEIGCKAVSGKLTLPKEMRQWYREALETHDIIEIPVTGDIGMLSASLPMHHRDPADRIIIATSKQKQLPIITLDTRFEDYGVQIHK
jgi:PIN domain nuclease of toxin-antitoxin system